MTARLTDYERLVTILPRKEKAKVIAWCEENNYRASQVMREALREFFKKKGVQLV